MFTTLSVPVMTRLRQPERLVLDTLVDPGVARSRSEARAWAVRLVGGHATRWLGELQQARSTVDDLRARGPELETHSDRPGSIVSRRPAGWGSMVPVAESSEDAMSQQEWTAVDDYLAGALVESDAALEAALAASDAAGLPAIAVSPVQGKLLHLLAKLAKARRILELGTLGGYSTIWLARALPRDGRLITLEYQQKHADVARANIARAGLADLVDVRVGAALDMLPSLAQDLATEQADPFDLVFIDADKVNLPDYFTWSVRLTRPGGVIIVDNVVRGGDVVNAHSEDPNVQGVRRLNEVMAADPLVSATTIQTVGVKGYDGFAIAIVGKPQSATP